MNRFLALDFETSHVDPARGAPVSLALVLFENGAVASSCEWLCAPPVHYKTGKITREYDIRALEVSAYTWPQIKRDGIPCADVCRQLDEWVAARQAGTLEIVAFNASFDLAFWRTLMFLGDHFEPETKSRRAHVSPLIGPWWCAMQLAIEYAPGLEDYKLDTVASHFHLGRTSDAHSAIEDAELAGRIFLKLLDGRRVQDVPA